MTVKQLKYRCSVDGKTLTVENVNRPCQYLHISFQRTIRVPDNVEASFLPPGLGCFPLYKVQDYASRLPPELASKGGVFLPMHQKEAMWIRLSSTTPFMIKIYCGGVNAVSGEHHSEDLSTKFRRLKLNMDKESIQDYIVTPEQLWVDGIATEPGIVRQFVAMPMGQGYTVEAQLTGKETNGGLQFEITPSFIKEIGSTPRAENDFSVNIKTLTGKTLPVPCNLMELVLDLKSHIHDIEGIPPDEQRLTWKGKVLENGIGDVLHLVLRISGGAAGPGLGREMGIAAGGKIKQTIARDRHDPRIWEDQVTLTIPVHILNSTAFHAVTGHTPPPCPIDASTYAEANLPFFDLYEEPSSVAGDFEALKSVNEIEQDRGLAEESEPSVKPRLVKLDRHGRAIPTGSQVDLSAIVDDPDGILSPAGPLRELRTLADLKREIKSLTLDSEDKLGF
ncbi:hypothetical protein DL768_011427 [Monosporascus sp. mg162]|nr:hypothetical protein DL768_011427 [Monosporascus sp. mg162]